MKIILLVTTFNSLTQSYFVKLKDLGYKVDVVYAINKTQMIKEVNEFNPDIIICPFLKKFVPSEIFTKYPTFIVHPGPIGDKGAYSIDNAIRTKQKRWGVTILRANEEFDGGDIYVSLEFDLRETYKASIYRNETLRSASKALDILLKNLQNPHFNPIKQLDTPMHLRLTLNHRKIDWQNDTTQQIIQKIYMSDSYPGVKDNILGVECYLFGAWEEEKIKGKPKEILAKRDGAICIGTKDSAIWITHLKEVGKFKLPATYVLKEKLKGIKENRLPLIFDKSYKTFYEISADIKDDIAYLSLSFHIGAFRADQCMRF